MGWFSENCQVIIQTSASCYCYQLIFCYNPAELLARLFKQKDAETALGRAADVHTAAGNALRTGLIHLCGSGKALYATANARKYAGVATDVPAPAVARQVSGCAG